ncbi:tetratricopeptide repeat protein [Cellulomonas sp. 179-A 4D5 NHS]|uniref:tetratricopeptide repeat protein n=1 Tax=Cellulomonas sp. 179-A 4D5 NHS TaxID=3142378 RepID=UPI0039A06774
MLAPKWEKELYAAAVQQRNVTAIQRVAQDHPDARQTGALLEAVHGAIPAGDFARVQSLLGWLWATGYNPERDQFLARYLPREQLTLEIAQGITVELPLSRDTIGLALAEAHQSAGELRAASDVVEEVTPSTIAAVSLAELYGEQERWDEVISMTDGLTNEDEASMFLLVQRAAALREQGSPGAAREALKEALRLRSRPAELRHQALVERAYTYLAESKPAMARRDLEKVLAENSAYPGLREAMAELPRD